MIKSIGAVIAGFLVVAVLSTITDMVLEKMGIFPSFAYQMKYGSPTWLLFSALFYRSIYTVLGGYVTAFLAPGSPKKLITILGIIGTIAGTVGVLVGWNLSAHWYPVALAVTAFPLIWIGGMIRIKMKGGER